MAEYPYTYARVKVPSGTRQLLAVIQDAGFTSAADLYYKVTTTVPAFSRATDPVANGFTATSSSNIINVQDNDYVTFSLMGKNTSTITTKVSVVSLPDFTTLGTFNLIINTAATADVTPNPTPNWCDISANMLQTSYVYTSQLVTGINTQIALRINYTLSSNSQLYYYTGSSPFPVGNCSVDSLSPGMYGMSPILPADTIYVDPNTYVAFGVDFVGEVTDQTTITVQNMNDGNVTLDTFLMKII